jgi:hypothetical protein
MKSGLPGLLFAADRILIAIGLEKRHRGQITMNRRQKLALVFVVCLVASAALADSLELNNGSLIKGKFMGGNQNSVNFQVGSSMQSYSVGDIRALRFDSEPDGAGVSVPSDVQSYGVVVCDRAFGGLAFGQRRILRQCHIRCCEYDYH